MKRKLKSPPLPQIHWLGGSREAAMRRGKELPGVKRHRRAEVMAEAIEHERAKGWQNLSDDEQREAQAAYAAFWRLWKLAGEDVFPRPDTVRRLVPVLLEIIEPYERAMDELFKPHEREID